MFHIIDDNKPLCDLTGALISEFGYQASCFYDAMSYLEQLLSGQIERPLAIFTDIRMPDMDGHQLIQQVKSIFPDQKIVAISGFDEEYERTKHAVCHFLSKPYRPEELAQTVEALICCNAAGPSNGTRIKCRHVSKALHEDDFQCPLQRLSRGSD